MYKVITFSFFLSFVLFQCQSVELQKSSEKEFLIGSTSTPKEMLKKNAFLTTTKKGIYYKDKLIFRNILTDEEYSEYSYLGECFDQSLIMQQDYNGSYYFLYDTINKKKSDIGGKPFFFNDYLLTINEDSTTDNKDYLTIWHTERNVLQKVITIKYSIYRFVDVRINKKDGFFYLKNSNNVYEKIKIPNYK